MGCCNNFITDLIACPDLDLAPLIAWPWVMDGWVKEGSADTVATCIGWCYMESPISEQGGGLVAHTSWSWKDKGSEGWVLHLFNPLLKFMLSKHCCRLHVGGGEGNEYPYIKIVFLEYTTPDSIGWRIQLCTILTISRDTIGCHRLSQASHTLLNHCTLPWVGWQWSQMSQIYTFAQKSTCSTLNLLLHSHLEGSCSRDGVQPYSRARASQKVDLCIARLCSVAKG